MLSFDKLPTLESNVRNLHCIFIYFIPELPLAGHECTHLLLGLIRVQQLRGELLHQPQDRGLGCVPGSDARLERRLQSLWIDAIAPADEGDLRTRRLVVPAAGLLEVMALAHHLEHITAEGHLLDMNHALAAVHRFGQRRQSLAQSGQRQGVVAPPAPRGEPVVVGVASVVMFDGTSSPSRRLR